MAKATLTTIVHKQSALSVTVCSCEKLSLVFQLKWSLLLVSYTLTSPTHITVALHYHQSQVHMHSIGNDF